LVNNLHVHSSCLRHRDESQHEETVFWLAYIEREDGFPDIITCEWFCFLFILVDLSKVQAKCHRYINKGDLDSTDLVIGRTRQEVDRYMFGCSEKTSRFVPSREAFPNSKISSELCTTDIKKGNSKDDLRKNATALPTLEISSPLFAPNVKKMGCGDDLCPITNETKTTCVEVVPNQPIPPTTSIQRTSLVSPNPLSCHCSHIEGIVFIIL
jgi:hypothetical protein